MSVNISSKLFRVTAGATCLALGMMVGSSPYGQAQSTIPPQVVGTWTKTQTVPVRSGTATIVDRISIAASGSFQYSNSSSAPFQTNCTLTARSSITGRATEKNSSTLDVTTIPGTLNVVSSCNSSPISQKTIPVLQGSLTWRRADDPTGEKLCLKGRLSSSSGRPSTIPLNNCYNHQ